MVNFKKLTDQAKDLVEKRGGTEGLKQDAAQLKEIAKGEGTLSDKAKAAAAALKETGEGKPGAESSQPAAGGTEAPASTPAPAAATDTPPAAAGSVTEQKAQQAKESAAAKPVDAGSSTGNPTTDALERGETTES